MYDTFWDRVSQGFTGFDWWLLLVLSLVAALIMRKWAQWPSAAALAFFADAIAPFVYRWATGVPPDFAFDFAISRLDERGGIVVLMRLGLYLGLIGVIFLAKRKYGRD